MKFNFTQAAPKPQSLKEARRLIDELWKYSRHQRKQAGVAYSNSSKSASLNHKQK